jgi:predicted ATPase
MRPDIGHTTALEIGRGPPGAGGLNRRESHGLSPRTKAMITRLRVKNFKALRDVEIQLTPIHVLIGPNDSGKTSILDALAALCRSVDHDLADAFLGSWKGAELVWNGEHAVPVSITVDFEDDGVTAYTMDVRFATRGRQAEIAEETFRKGQVSSSFRGPPAQGSFAGSTRVRYESEGPGFADLHSERWRAVKDLLEGMHYYRWDPASLALPVAPDVKRCLPMESNGIGLALCLGDIKRDNSDGFRQLQDRLTEIFPHIASIEVSAEADYRAGIDNPERVETLQVYFKLRVADQRVSASQVSDGVLLVLAYLAILYLPHEKRPRVLLVEEPENGIHPKRLRNVVTILRELVNDRSHTQVVLTTHSPYMLDLFRPEEVTLCTMQDNGEVKTTRLSESPAVKRESGVFTLGEIWTSEGDETIAHAQETTGESTT